MQNDKIICFSSECACSKLIYRLLTHIYYLCHLLLKLAKWLLKISQKCKQLIIELTPSKTRRQTNFEDYVVCNFINDKHFPEFKGYANLQKYFWKTTCFVHVQ